MRLGILGPAYDDLVGLARAAQYLVDDAQAEKVVYLGNDGALERVVVGWAQELVGADPREVALFERAAARCANATPEKIDRFVERERARLRLKVFVNLPSGTARSIEILDGRVAVFVHDKGTLDAEDISPASLLVFGKSTEPMIRRVGARVFVSPGPIGCAGGGSAVLDDGSGGVRIEILNGAGAVTLHDLVAAPAPAGVGVGKMRVQGG